jgi:hypothetical protein
MDEKEDPEQPESLNLAQQVLIALLIGVPLQQVENALQPFQNHIVLEPLSHSPSSEIQIIPPLSDEESEDGEPITKKQKCNHETATQGPYKETTQYAYLLLSSGREFYFEANEGATLITPPHVESRPFVRKLLSRIPTTPREALLFLSDFVSEEKTIVIDVDRVSEPSTEHSELDLSALFSRDDLIIAYVRETRLRRAFRTLLQKWRIYRIEKKHVPEVDPITLSPPEKEVHVYDLAVRKKFTFEARSLANHMETQLAYAEGGFALPIFPKNPWTNADFTYYQLISIYYQLRAHGELRWGLITLQKYHFDLHRWHNYHRSTLTLQSIKNCLRRLDSADARDILEDFILDQLEEAGVTVTDYLENAYRVSMRNDPDHWYLQYWKEIAWVRYEADHFSRNRVRYIQSRCEKIIRHQRRFLNDLVEKRWIPPENARV